MTYRSLTDRAMPAICALAGTGSLMQAFNAESNGQAIVFGSLGVVFLSPLLLLIPKVQDRLEEIYTASYDNAVQHTRDLAARETAQDSEQAPTGP